MPQLFPPEIIKNSYESYFCEQSSSGRSIYLSVILFLIVSFALLPTVNVQVTTQSEGVVRSLDEDNPIVAVISGEVRSCRISENQFVAKDDTLLVIATDRIDQEIKLLTFQKLEYRQHLTDLSQLVAGENGKLYSAVYKQEFIAHQGKLAEQLTQLQQAENEYLLARLLFDKGITPKHDLEKILRQFQFEKSKYASLNEQQKTFWQGKLQEAILNLAELEIRMKQLETEKRQYCLTASITGHITGFTGIKPGNFIYPNMQIATIAPGNDLLVECYVPPSDIGLIEQGMSASFQFHAFNYNLWGVGTGKVNEISNSVVSINNTPFFRIKCQLDQNFLQLKNGCIGKLKKGMTLTGRFKVAERTLFQLLYDKADNWLNPKRKNG
jgi:HlyD family secretion protein